MTMIIIVDATAYKYISLIFATTFLVPQIIHSVRAENMEGVSSIGIFFIFTSSFLWFLYMFEHNLFYYWIATAFVTLCSMCLLFLKCFFGIKNRFKPDTPIPVTFIQSPESKV